MVRGYFIGKEIFKMILKVADSPDLRSAGMRADTYVWKGYPDLR